MTVAERLERNIFREPNSGCWLWVGYCTPEGYAQMTIGGAKRCAHRVAYECLVAPIPADKYACHRCDVPSCVNPAHVFLGTPKDNMVDKAVKGRAARGMKNGLAKLTDADVISIRADRRPQRIIAKDFGVAQSLISPIKQRQIWKHIPEPRAWI